MYCMLSSLKHHRNEDVSRLEHVLLDLFHDLSLKGLIIIFITSNSVKKKQPLHVTVSGCLAFT